MREFLFFYLSTLYYMYSWQHRTFDRKGTSKFQLLFFSSCKILTLLFVSGSCLPNLLLKICSAYYSTWPITALLKYFITGTMRRFSLVFFFDTSGYIYTAQWKEIIFFLFAADIYLYWYFVFTQGVSFSCLDLHAPCFIHCP